MRPAPESIARSLNRSSVLLQSASVVAWRCDHSAIDSFTDIVRGFLRSFFFSQDFYGVVKRPPFADKNMFVMTVHPGPNGGLWCARRELQPLAVGQCTRPCAAFRGARQLSSA